MSLETVQSQPSPAPVSVDDYSAFTADDLRGALSSGSLDALTPPAVSDAPTPPQDPIGDGDAAAAPAEASAAEPTQPDAAEETSETPAAAVRDEAATFQFTPDAVD